MDPEKGYEFDEGQNETIRTLSKSLQFVGLAGLAFSLMFAIDLLHAVMGSDWSDAVSQGVILVFMLAMGSLMLKAGREFQAIVDTEGKDISHLMIALDNLRKMYSVLSVIILISIVLTLVALALALVPPSGPAIAGP
jgi:hypothetical protein